MDGRLEQEKPLTHLNSSASVSDLSEALSDMSISTSPGSGDVIAQDLNNLPLASSAREGQGESKGMKEEITTPPAPPRKRLVVRQMSSNPYLASAEMSPSDDHPLIAGSHSYAAGESRLYHGFSAYSYPDSANLFNRSNSYPLTSDCVEETDEEEDDDDEDEEDEEEESQIGENSIRYEGPCKSNSTSGVKIGPDSPGLVSSSPAILPYSASTSGSNQLDVNQVSHSRSTKALTPGVSPSHLQCYSGTGEYKNDNELPNGHIYTQEEPCIRRQSYQSSSSNSQHHHFGQQGYHGHTHHRRHHSHQPNHQSALNQQTHSKSQETGCSSSRRNKNGYSYQKNSVQNESSVQDTSVVTNSYSDTKQQSGVMEVNAWGHFYRQQENHYKYRRSHYSSDSEDEAAPQSCSKAHYSKHVRPQFHQHYRSTGQYRSRQQSPPPAQTVQIPVDKADGSQSGMKPMEFRNRFQTMQRWFSECNDSQKNLVLKGLLGICELPQLHLLSVLMSKELHHGCPSNCEDIITWLPTDLATKVMSYLDPVSLCHASQVCKVWHQLADDQTLWRRFCCQTKWRLSRAAEHKQVISHMSQEGSIQWKHVFAERFRLRNNWLKGRCTVRTFEGHLQGISCVQFDDSRIVSGSSDKTIKVWNMRTNAPWSVQTLMGHHGTVRCLHLEGNRLVSGSCDTTIKVWDLSAQESWSSIACKVTMTGHTDTVRCLQADDDKVISGSYDKTLKIWDLKSGELRRTLKGHQASVLCVHFSETKIVSGSADKTIKLWNYEGSCMMTLCGHQDAVTCLMFDSTRVVSGSLDHNLKFWDIHSGQCLNTIDWKKAEGHTDVVRCLQADSWRVVSAADDKTIKVWNLETGERLVTLRNHTDGVTCLQFNDFIIVSGSYDKSVKLWDFSSC